MSYTVCNVLDLGETYTSAALNAQLYDDSDNPVGGAITTGFYERAGAKGIYTFTVTIPNGHQGWCDIYVNGAPTNILATLPINPAELENADIKTSTRSTFAGGAVASVTGSVGSVANPVTVGTNNDKTGYTLSGAGILAIWDALLSTFATVGSIGKLIKDYLDLAVSSRATVADIPTTSQINTALSTAHGAGSWATAIGFATPANVTNAQTAITNAIAALNNLGVSDIDARLVAYDGATQPDLDTAKAALLAAIAALNNLSPAQAQTAATAALNAYDGPTKAELDAAQAAIQSDIAGISGGGGGSSAADIWTYPDRTITGFGSITGIQFTYTVTSTATGLPISGVTVWFASDGAGNNIVWTGITDTFGIARDSFGALPKLDAGTYFIFRAKPGYIFQDPDTEIVNA